MQKAYADPMPIVLIANQTQQQSLVAWVQHHAPVLARYPLVSIPPIADLINRATSLTVAPGLPTQPTEAITQSLAQAIAAGNLMALIFFIDPVHADPALPDIQTLSALCSEYDLPLAFNPATATAVLNMFMQLRVAHLIFNPVAGQRDPTEDLLIIRQTLAPLMNLSIHFTTREVDANELAQRAIAAQPDLIIASGGDGTVSAVADVLLGTGIPLGIIPRGTANAFSVALGIPTTPKAACDLILAGTMRIVDVARCNGRLMILLTGVGFEAEAVEKADRELKDQWGVLAYLMAGWQQLGEQQLFHTRLDVGDRSYQFRAGAITIANAAPPTSVLAQGVGQVIFDDGLLDVTVLTGEQEPRPTILNKLRVAKSLLAIYGAALASTRVDDSRIYHFRSRQLTITATPAQKVVVDGEMVGTTPITVECLPGRLTVLAPPQIKPSPLEKLAMLWVQRVSPSLTAMIVAIGATGLIGCFIALWVLGRLATGFFWWQTIADFDFSLLMRIHSWANPALDQIMLGITRLGNAEVVLPTALLVLGILWGRQEQRQVWTCLTAFLGALVMNFSLKPLFMRLRPDLWPTLITETSYSFPSGHALGSTVLYGMIAYLLGRHFPKYQRWFYGAALVLVGLISFSRLYLGVHWPSDVIAGMSIGFLWLMVGVTMSRLQDLREEQAQTRQPRT
ncbi:diacylglycerol kinase family protein [Trichothermofontia sp.]